MSVLDRLQIGSVRYLNSKPLIAAYGGPITLEHPSVLARKLVSGELDVALVPVFEALRSPGFQIVDGVSISAFGPVWSVYVAHREPVEEIETLYLDPASLTSAHLCKVIFAEFLERTPRYLDFPPEAGAARLLIGNQAIQFRAEQGSAYRYLDFGEEWRCRTGLPFVFAVWLMRPGLECASEAAEAFRALAAEGQKMIPSIVKEEREFGPEFTERYLTEHIKYSLGEPEKRGLERFRELLDKHGILRSFGDRLVFV